MALICGPVIGRALGAPVAPKCRRVIFSWVALSMSPAFRMSPAVSSRAFASGLTFFFFAMVYLLNNAFRKRLRQSLPVRFEPEPRDLPRGREFVIFDIPARAFGKAKQNHRAGLRAVSDQHAKAARASLSGPRHKLLDDTASHIRVHQAALDSFTEHPKSGSVSV